MWRRIESGSAKGGVITLVCAALSAPLVAHDSDRLLLVAGLIGVALVSLVVSFISFRKQLY